MATEVSKANAAAEKRATDMKILSNGKVMKVQKTRQRKILSCIYCHSKKIKCSRQLPTCDNCEKLKLECQYFANDRILKGGKQRTGTNGTSISSSGNNVDGIKFEAKSISPELSSLNSHPTGLDGGINGATENELTSLSSNEPVENHHIPDPEHHPDSQMDDSHIPNAGNNMVPNPMINDFAHDGKLADTFSPNFPSFPKSLLQTPVINNNSNNITSNFFQSIPNNGSHQDLSNPQENKEDLYLFNLSSFTFTSYPNNPSNNPPQNYSKFITPEIPSNLPSHNNSSTNISSLFAKSPGRIYPQTNVQSFMDRSNNPSSSPVIGSGANMAQNNNGNSLSFLNHPQPLHTPQNQIPNHIPIQTPTPLSQSQFQAHLLSHVPNTTGSNLMATNMAFNEMSSGSSGSGPNGISSANSDDDAKLDNTKNFLNGTNNYYDNENLLEDLEKLLPNTKERSFELMDRYLNSVHILLPIITNIKDFLEEHEKFWNECNPYDKQSNNHLTDLNPLQFYTLYFPILYASTISEFEEYDNVLLNQDINKYLNGFNKICQYYNYPHGLKIIPLLLGNVIIQSTSPNPSTMEMSQIIRYAKFLEINKDPVKSLNIQNFEIIKFRRLLWWTIFGLDCLTSHNFCLPPVCRFDDFNVLLPNEQEPVFNEYNEMTGYELNPSILSLNIKFRYDRILNELVNQLHNDTSKNISIEKMNEIKKMIVEYFEFIHLSINRMNSYHKKCPPKTVNEINLTNFIKNHSWSFVDRALMLLHKKYLLNQHNTNTSLLKGSSMYNNDSFDNGTGDEDESLSLKIDKQNKRRKSSTDSRTSGSSVPDSSVRSKFSYNVHLNKPRNGKLSFNEYEDTFQSLAESNLIKNFLNYKDLNINLEFHKLNNFNYNDLSNNLIPSILHNLNDFLKYNDFLKFGKYNWYVKRTIPLDSIILLFIILVVKFKSQVIRFNELIIIVKLINKSLFILNRKWFKTEKYKRMLSLTNLTWEYILKKFNILQIINKFTNSNFSINSSSKNKIFNKYEYFNYQLTGYVNSTELFKTMQVAQPILSIDLINTLNEKNNKFISSNNPSVNVSNNSTTSPTPMLENSTLNSHTLNSIFNPGMSPTQNKNNHNQATFDLIGSEVLIDENQTMNSKYDIDSIELNEDIKIENDFNISLQLINQFDTDKKEVSLLKEKIVFDLKNNYVDINEYCAFYISLENVLHELMAFIEG